MKKISDILEKCPLFKGLSEADIKLVLSEISAKERHAEKGETILCEGEPAVYLGIVLRGSVRVIREDYYGNRSIVAHMLPGDIFGESLAFAEVGSIPVSVIAEEECEYLLIESKRLLCESSFASGAKSLMLSNLLRIMAQKNLLINQKLEITSKRTTRDKLMAYLMNEAKTQKKDEFLIPYDRQALADYLEVDRSGLSSEIGRLCREGRISCKKNRFRLL